MEHIEFVNKVLEYHQNHPKCAMNEYESVTTSTNEMEIALIKLIACIIRSGIVEITPESVHKKLLETLENPDVFYRELDKKQVKELVKIAKLLILKNVNASEEEIRNQFISLGFGNDKTFTENYPQVYAEARKNVLESRKKSVG